jgi:AcrR family transcriptional regulator
VHPEILTPKQRRQRNRDEMVAAIVQVARAVMQEQGVAALNLSEIARRVGMQTPSLYEYFANKLALVDYLFLLAAREYRAVLRAFDAESATSPWALLEQALSAHMRFAVENPDFFKLLFERHIPGFEPSEASMVEARALLDEADRYVLRFVNEAGLEPDVELQPVRDFLFAVMHGVSAQHLANEPHLPVGEGRFGSLVPFVIATLKSAWESKGS